MLQVWISRIGFTLALLAFVGSMAVHLATFAGLGAAQAAWIFGMQIVALFLVTTLMVVVLLSAALTPGPREPQVVNVQTSWQARIRTRLALLPRWYFLLMLLALGLNLYGLGWDVWTLLTPLNDAQANSTLPNAEAAIRSLRAFSAGWAGMYLLWAVLIGQFGLGWLRRWSAQAAGV